MNILKHSLRLGACVVASCLPITADAAEPKLPTEGWVSWEVPAVKDAPAWCCFSGGFEDGNTAAATCRLDESSGQSVGSRDNATTDAITVYARVSNGKLELLRTLAASCPVETRTPVSAAASVTADDSARWLSRMVLEQAADANEDHGLGDKALASLALHGGAVAKDSMSDTARNGVPPLRKKAVFWLALLRGEEGAAITRQVMLEDRDPDVREHAVFAMSQSKAPSVAQDLIRVGNTDVDSDVRARAWFWLAHTGAPDAEKAIGAALRKDTSEEVREQAIFALSRLPGERATSALIAVAEDKALTQEQRKRAIFWLAQSGTDRAQDWLDGLLSQRVE